MELVLEARKALAGRIRRTPTEFSAALSDAAKVPVFLKLESLQLTGSFKIRGAFFAFLNLSDDERRRGIVTCSAGNHGKAVAYVARELGVPAEIHVPRDVDESKYQGMLALGANVVRSEFDGFDETEQLAQGRGGAHGSPVRDRVRRRPHPRRQRRDARRRDDRGLPRGADLPAAGRRRGPGRRLRVLREDGAAGFARGRLPARALARPRAVAREGRGRRSSCRPSRRRPAASRAASAGPASRS